MLLLLVTLGDAKSILSSPDNGFIDCDAFSWAVPWSFSSPSITMISGFEEEEEVGSSSLFFILVDYGLFLVSSWL